MQQQRLASRASDLSRRIYASLPWGLRVANMLMVLASGTQDAFGRVIYAEFIKRGVEDMPDIGGEPASAWKEKLQKLNTRAGDKVPRGYGLEFAKKVWGIALKETRDPSQVEDVMYRTMEKFIKSPNLVDEGSSRRDAEAFVIRIVKNDLRDQYRSQKRGPQLGLGDKDEEGDFSGDVLDPDTLRNIGELISPTVMREIERDLAKLHPSAPAYVNLLTQEYDKNEIARKGLLPHWEGKAVSPQAMATFERNWLPDIKRIIWKHLRDRPAA